MTETRLHLECWAEQCPQRRGWLARYQTDKGVRTVTSRWARRAALIFGSEQDAKIAAGEALLKHLNSNPRPRSSGAKTFAVARNGRHVRTISLPRT
jgi:hypothetical protein